MNWENLKICCLKGLKHGETTCPVCGRRLTPFNEPEVKPTANGLKATLLIPFIALSLNSCKSDHYETGIVKDKIENRVYMSPVDDTSSVYRIIDCDTITKSYRHANKNLYLNMNKGDTVVWYNHGDQQYIIPAMTTYRSGGIIGNTSYDAFNVVSVNGIRPYDLPDLLKKQRIEQQNKKAQQEYNKARSR